MPYETYKTDSKKHKNKNAFRPPYEDYCQPFTPHLILAP